MIDFNDKARPPPRTLAKLVSELAYRHSAWQVFSDFAEMAAISLSNAIDIHQAEKREARYMEIVKRYKPDEVKKFPEMLAALVDALEDEPSDVMGRTFHELELHNKWAGQYFSPYPLCQMMAKLTLGDENSIREKISERGFITAQEPACGSGAMVIALAQSMKDLGVNYQQHLHVTAIDVDAKCVHMAYAQFALLHIPAVIVHGNALTLEEYGHWFTPAHIMGGWHWKLKQHPIDTAHVLQAASPERPKEPQPDTKGPTGSQLTLF